MKRKVFAFASVFMCVLLSGCSGTSAQMPLFVYALGCDAKTDGTGGVVLYAVAAREEDGEKSSNDSASGKGGNGENQKSSSDSQRNKAVVYEYEGKSVSDAYNKFFEAHKNVYTGTVKEYVVGEGLGEEGLYDFKVYLTNSPKLPVKKKTHTKADTAEYFYENPDRWVK